MKFPARKLDDADLELARLLWLEDQKRKRRVYAFLTFLALAFLTLVTLVTAI
jgi:hypothetical protein